MDKAVDNSLMYFKLMYTLNLPVRNKYWKEEYFNEMKEHQRFRGTVVKKKNQGGEEWYRQQTDFIWGKLTVHEKQKWKEESLNMKKLIIPDLSENTTLAQVEGVPSPTPPPPYIEKKNIEVVHDHKDAMIKKFCSNCKKDRDENDIFCNQCAARLEKYDFTENILERVIPELSNIMIYQKQDESFTCNLSIKDLYSTNSLVATYNNPDGSNYICFYEYPRIVQLTKVGCFRNDHVSLGDILSILVLNEITHPVCRTGLFMKASKNWWNKKFPDNTLIEFKSADDVMHISNGLLIRKDVGFENAALMQESKENCCIKASESKEDLILRNALEEIKEDLYYLSKTDKLYTMNQLYSMFSFENSIIKSLDFKNYSKLMRIFNVNIYVLDESIDALFECKTFREKIKPINRFEFNIKKEDVFPSLLGIP